MVNLEQTYIGFDMCSAIRRVELGLSRVTNDGVEVVTNDLLEVFGDAHWSKQKEPSLRDTEYASLAKPEELGSTEWIEEI
jgi:hypothetical protein